MTQVIADAEPVVEVEAERAELPVAEVRLRAVDERAAAVRTRKDVRRVRVGAHGAREEAACRASVLDGSSPRLHASGVRQRERGVQTGGDLRDAGQAGLQDRKYLRGRPAELRNDQLQHLHGHAAPGRRIVAELSGAVQSPGPNRSVAQQCDRMSAAGGDLPDTRQPRYGDRQVDARVRAVAELSVVAEPPRDDGSVALERERVSLAGGNADDARQERIRRRLHLHRKHAVGTAVVAELSEIVLSPRPDGAVAAKGERERVAGGNGDDVRQIEHGCRHVPLARRTDAELPLEVATPRLHRAVLHQRQRVQAAGRDRANAGHDERPVGNVDDGVVADLSVLVAADRIERSVIGQQQAVRRAGRRHRPHGERAARRAGDRERQENAGDARHRGPPRRIGPALRRPAVPLSGMMRERRARVDRVSTRGSARANACA